jgi:hypothetical protein
MRTIDTETRPAMSFEEAVYEEKYRESQSAAKQYLQACIEDIRSLAKNSSHEDVRARHHSADFDTRKHAEMFVRNPMLANDYLNGYIELVRRKAAVIDAKINLEESMTATTGFTITPAPKIPAADATQKTPVQKPKAQAEAPQSGWQKFKKSLFGKSEK